MNKTPLCRPCKHNPMQPESCAACRSIATNPALAHLRGPLPNVSTAVKPKAKKSFATEPECVFRGGPTGDTRPCKTCTKTSNIPLYSCNKHGTCSTNRAVVDEDGKPIALCMLCVDRVKPVPVLKIPKRIHRIWVGGKPIPERFEAYWDSWKSHHPEWDFYTWTDADIVGLGADCARLCGECRNPAEMSDVMRFYIVEQYGGVYVDTDFECLKRLTPALVGYDFVSAWENPDMIASAFFAATPGHPILQRFVGQLRTATIDKTVTQIKTAGPRAFTAAVGDVNASGVCIHPTKLFYPVPYDQRSKQPKISSDAYAAHWWAHTWEEYWTTITFVLLGGATMTATVGQGDVITDNLNDPINTTHYCLLRAGDNLTQAGLEQIRKTLRFAPNYAENDFAFKDNKGGWFRVFATVDRGNPIARVDGKAVLMRV